MRTHKHRLLLACLTMTGWVGGPFVAGVQTKSPSAVGLIDNEWKDPTNTLTSNNLRAEARPSVSTKNDQDVHTFGFALPAGSTIDGIEVAIEAAAVGGGSAHLDCQLIRAGVRTGDTKSTPPFTSGSDTVVTLGGSTDDWNASLGQTELEASNFGVHCHGVIDSGGNPRIGVDHISVTAHFTSGRRRVILIE